MGFYKKKHKTLEEFIKKKKKKINYLQFRSELFVLVCKSVQQNPHYVSIQILVNNEQYQSFQQNSMLYFDLLDFNIL